MTKARGLADLGNAYSDGALSNRNLIINGDMQVAQRGTSATGVTTSGYYTCDRWRFGVSGLGTHTITQETDAPNGFTNSFKMECTAADASPASGDSLLMNARLEGYDLQRLKYGTADALPVTLSFWVKASKSGTHIIEFISEGNHICSQYTITSAGTWEKISITIDGNTSDVISNGASQGLSVIWWLGAGTNFTNGTLQTTWATSVNANRAVGTQNYASTIGQYFQITGVQLEAGDTATPFEHPRSYGDELARCQRYYAITGDSYSSWGNSSLYANWSADLPVEMRATPTLTRYNSGGTVFIGPTGSRRKVDVLLSGIGTGSAYRVGYYCDAEL